MIPHGVRNAAGEIDMQWNQCKHKNKHGTECESNEKRDDKQYNGCQLYISVQPSVADSFWVRPLYHRQHCWLQSRLELYLNSTHTPLLNPTWFCWLICVGLTISSVFHPMLFVQRWARTSWYPFVWGCEAAFLGLWIWPEENLHRIVAFEKSPLNCWTDTDSAELRIITEHLSQNYSLWTTVITVVLIPLFNTTAFLLCAGHCSGHRVGTQVNKAIGVPAHLCSFQLKHFQQLGDHSLTGSHPIFKQS